MKGIRVPLKDAENMRQKLSMIGAMDREHEILKDRDHVIIPILPIHSLHSIQPPLESVLNKSTKCEIVDADFTPLKKRENLEDCLEKYLCKGEIEVVKSAFDVIGDIAIIEVGEGMEMFEEIIAGCIIKVHKNIKTVYKKASEIKGKERVRELAFLKGEKRSKTLYKEHGMRLKLDIKKVYFSPRLGHERKRVLGQVKDKEIIVDLFAGIGPFSILIAKNRDVKVYAIDVNPHAVRYLEENVKLNKVGDRVESILGDCRHAAPKNVADRVIMNLPKSSDEFLDLAFDVIKRGVIHFYTISPRDDLYESKIEFVKKTAEKKGRKIEVLNKKIVRPYSPRKYHVVIDVLVK